MSACWTVTARGRARSTPARCGMGLLLGSQPLSAFVLPGFLQQLHDSVENHPWPQLQCVQRASSSQLQRRAPNPAMPYRHGRPDFMAKRDGKEARHAAAAARRQSSVAAQLHGRLSVWRRGWSVFSQKDGRRLANSCRFLQEPVPDWPGVARGRRPKQLLGSSSPERRDNCQCHCGCLACWIWYMKAGIQRPGISWPSVSTSALQGTGVERFDDPPRLLGCHDNLFGQQLVTDRPECACNVEAGNRRTVHANPFIWARCGVSSNCTGGPDELLKHSRLSADRLGSATVVRQVSEWHVHGERDGWLVSSLVTSHLPLSIDSDTIDFEPARSMRGRCGEGLLGGY